MSPVSAAEPSASLMSTSQMPSQLKNTFATTASSIASNDANTQQHKSNKSSSRVSDSSRLELSNKAANRIETPQQHQQEQQQQQQQQQPYSDKNNMKTINNTEHSFGCNKLQKATTPSVCTTEKDGGNNLVLVDDRQTKENKSKITARKNSAVPPQPNLSNSTNGSNSSDQSNKPNDNIQIKNECDQIIIKSEIAAENPQTTTLVVAEKETENATASMESITSRKPRSILLDSVNPHIMCNLCFGYLIDATTIVECLHSFCHSCLIKHLRSEQYCPRCEMMINTVKPNIKPDTTLQAIVYKLVPGLYERELMRKRAFYKDRPTDAAQATPEQRGDDTEHLIFSPSDYMSLSLEYADIDEHINTNADYSIILKPRYLQCPSMYTVAHLKKFVHGKFQIDNNKFNIDIMYKVKTIVLLDHYTLMDVAYIYTWKRDAPMRFYFRVKESLKPLNKIRKPVLLPAKPVVLPQPIEELKPELPVMSIVHAPASPAPTSNVEPIIQLTDIKVEEDAEYIPEPQQRSPVPKQFEIVPQVKLPACSNLIDDHSNTDKLKITLVSKTSKDKHLNGDHKSSSQVKSSKDKRESTTSAHKEERKVENIKLKIDLSKQNSVTIINMSDSNRKEVTKSVKPEKEWKVKNKKDKDGSPKSSPNSEKRRKTLSPLTVPPLTIKAERISPLAKTSPSSQSFNSPKPSSAAKTSEEEEKSLFLMAIALAPTKDVKLELKEKEKTTPAVLTSSFIKSKPTPDAIFKAPTHVAPKTSGPSKRKSKDSLKAVTKKPKLSNDNDFKIKLPPISNNVSEPITSPTSNKSTKVDVKPLMPPPAALPIMRPPISLPKKVQKQQNKFAPPGSLTPHPMHGASSPTMAAPGNRTPIAKRYQPILPKAARPNPFANIPSDVNKILKDAGTEIKSIANETSIVANPSQKVYGPKVDTTSMGLPPLPNQQHSVASPATGNRMNSMSNLNKPGPSNKSSNSNYLNLALYNATKSKGNEAPPGCQTPMYTPNSPIYSPNSPQYVPNYNIPTMPTYKYTPKPTNNSYLNNVLGGNNSMASLFPAPPTKKDTTTTQHSTKPPAQKTEYQHKRVYPFTRSPSPIEDPPEKQLKVKSLLTSCNINIPSSLSITITREDSESQLSASSYPKHKSPVNNYIEILKLPDQPTENHENNRLSPPVQQKSASETLAQLKKDSASYKHITMPHQKVGMQPPTQHNNFQNGNINSSKSLVSFHSLHQPPKTTTAPSTHAINPRMVKSPHESSKTQLPNNSPQNLTTHLQQQQQQQHQKQLQTPATQNQKPLQNPTTKPPYQKQVPPHPATPTPTATAVDSKKTTTPSPEKRPSDAITSACDSNNKSSPKSPNTPATDSAAMQASKKFRHILPRQNPTPISEVIPPKVTNASIIGTYASPSGVAVKVHGNKKVPPTKKSPGLQQEQLFKTAKSHEAVFKDPNASSSASSNPSSAKVSTSAKSPHATNYSKSGNTSKTTAPQLSSSSVNLTNNKLVSHHSPPSSSSSLATTLPTLPNIPHPMQAMAAAGLPNFSAHLGAAAAANSAAATSAGSQAEINKFLKDNLLRAQAAAAANQSNMFYSYANAAAHMSQYTPSMYNYQQAYIMEQLSRMQRAGNDALAEYMQKLKNGIDKRPNEGVNGNVNGNVSGNSSGNSNVNFHGNGIAESPKSSRAISSPKTSTTHTASSSASPNTSSATVSKANPTAKGK